MEILIGLILTAAIYFDLRYLRLKKNIPVFVHAAAAAFWIGAAVLRFGITVAKNLNHETFFALFQAAGLDFWQWQDAVFSYLSLALASLGYLLVRFGHFMKKARSQNPPLPPESHVGITFVIIAFFLYYSLVPEFFVLMSMGPL